MNIKQRRDKKEKGKVEILQAAEKFSVIYFIHAVNEIRKFDITFINKYTFCG